MMEKPAHVIRMEEELSGLEDKINPLEAFLNNAEQLENLNRTQIHLLNIQLDAMRSYHRVLKIRIEHDTEIAEYKALEAATEAAAEENNEGDVVDNSGVDGSGEDAESS